MNLTMSDLENCFNTANEHGDNYDEIEFDLILSKGIKSDKKCKLIEQNNTSVGVRL